MKSAEIEIYCNHGVLAAEKRNIYTYGTEHSHAVYADKMTVLIPEGWETYEGIYGNLLVEAPWGMVYDIHEVLTDRQGHPAFFALDKNQRPVTVYLYTAEELERKRLAAENKEKKSAKKKSKGSRNL